MAAVALVVVVVAVVDAAVGTMRCRSGVKWKERMIVTLMCAAELTHTSSAIGLRNKFHTLKHGERQGQGVRHTTSDALVLHLASLVVCRDRSAAAATRGENRSSR